MKAIGTYLIISKIDEEVKTDSGLVLTGDDVDQFRYRKGRVVNPGTEVSTINVDDIIFYDKSHSFTMIIDGVQYTIIQLRDVVVVL